jgi:hypothetical protein
MPGKTAPKKADSKRNPTLGFRCPPELRKLLAQRAKAERRSQAFIILRAIEAELKNTKPIKGE